MKVILNGATERKTYILKGKTDKGFSFIAKGPDLAKLNDDAFAAGVVGHTIRVEIQRG